MPWKIILEDENKTMLSSLSDELIIDLNKDLKNLKLLCYLDAYGDTIFNRNQMDDLIKDLKKLKLVKNNTLIDEIQMLAEQCKKVQHTYLVFYGD